jgi:hypothetical protein
MDRRFFSSLCLLTFVVSLLAHARAEEGKGRGAQDARIQRRNQLVKLLKGNVFTGYRAAEEIPCVGPLDASVWKTLIAVVSSQHDEGKLILPSRFVDALAACGPTAVPDLLAAVKLQSASETEDAFHLFLASLGRMGLGAGKQAIPALRSMLKDKQLAQRRKRLIRIVLANLGDDSVKNAEGDIDPLDSAVLQTIVHIRPGKWVTQDTVKRLTNHLASASSVKDDDFKLASPSFQNVALALGVLGERASSAGDALDALFKRTISDGNITAIGFGLALARVDPKRRDATLRHLCKNYSKLFEDAGRGTLLYLLEVPRTVVDAKLTHLLVRLLDDPDPAVAAGAGDVLARAGLSARDGVPDLLKYVGGTAAEQRRIMAAKVLSYMADYSHIPQLEKARAQEKSKAVRAELDLTVQFIKSLKSPD